MWTYRRIIKKPAVLTGITSLAATIQRRIGAHTHVVKDTSEDTSVNMHGVGPKMDDQILYFYHYSLNVMRYI